MDMFLVICGFVAFLIYKYVCEVEKTRQRENDAKARENELRLIIQMAKTVHENPVHEPSIID